MGYNFGPYSQLGLLHSPEDRRPRRCCFGTEELYLKQGPSAQGAPKEPSLQQSPKTIFSLQQPDPKISIVFKNYPVSSSKLARWQ